MKKLALVLVVGIAFGYWYGFNDARRNHDDIVTRTVDRVGGSNRELYRTDIDAKMEKLEKR